MHLANDGWKIRRVRRISHAKHDAVLLKNHEQQASGCCFVSKREGS